MVRTIVIVKFKNNLIIKQHESAKNINNFESMLLVRARKIVCGSIIKIFVAMC